MVKDLAVEGHMTGSEHERRAEGLEKRKGGEM